MKKKKLLSVRIDSDEEKNLIWLANLLGKSKPEILRKGLEILNYIGTESIKTSGKFEFYDIIKAISKL
jgi:hypothetical protein